jgi:hypothetical protein
MKIKLNEILLAKPGFEELIENKSIPIIMSYRLNKLIPQLNKELESFEKAKEELFKKYGEKKTDEDGKEVYEIIPENTSVFYNELSTLANEEIEIIFTPMDISKVMNQESLQNLNISPKNFAGIEKFFTGWDSIQ